jgi:DNA-binding Lrp family transcriptional regulator
VAEGVQKLNLAEARVISVDAVTGPFDVIALLEADDLDRLGRAVTEGIQQVDGVQRTTTCLVVRLST